jgi:hypothetical protein
MSTKSSWSHDAVFPIISRLIVALYATKHDFITHAEITAALVNDDEGRHVIRHARSLNQKQSDLLIATNMVAWFSQKITERDTDYRYTFDRTRMDNRWAYRPFDQELAPSEEPSTMQIYQEGAIKQVSASSYERNPHARHICIKYHGTSCSVCSFNFETVYGSIGVDFIHIHHIKPLSEIRAEHQVNPVQDLRPVCPNCHAMIHKRKPAYTIEEMKSILMQPRRAE